MMIYGIACTRVNVATPTVTRLISSGTVQPAHTPSPSDELSSPRVTQKCLPVLPRVPEDVRLSGKLIISSRDFSTESILSLPGFKQELSLDHGIVFVSPDHKRFAFLTGSDIFVYSQLLVMDSQGQLVTSFELVPKLEFPIQWVNNDSFLIRTSDLSSPMLLNVTTGEKQQVSFPYSKELSDRTLIAYNPTMSRVLYEKAGYIFVLRDMNLSDQPILWTRHNNKSWAKPAWSPDGNWVANTIARDDIRDIEDLLIVNADGFPEMQLITDIYEAYDHPTLSTIYHISWSPDSSQLAISLRVPLVNEQYPEYLTGRLLVINLANLATREIIDYCITHSSPPVWSPDGKYLAVDGFIVDLSKQIAYKITDGYIIGWLADD